MKETASTAALTTLYTFGWSMKLKRISTKWDIMNCVVVNVDLPHVNLIGLASLDISAFLFLLRKQTWNILH